MADIFFPSRTPITVVYKLVKYFTVEVRCFSGRLLGDSNSEIIIASAIALGEIKSKSAVSPLIKLLYRRSRNIKLAAVKSLGSIGSKEASDELFNLKTKTSNTQLLNEIRKASVLCDQEK